MDTEGISGEKKTRDKYENENRDSEGDDPSRRCIAFIFTAARSVLADGVRGKCEGYEPDFYVRGD